MFRPCYLGEMDAPNHKDEALSHAPDAENAPGPATIAVSAPQQSTASGDESQNAFPTRKLYGGCWTCRVRRQKCDEHDCHPDMPNHCRICLRLWLPCLGWSTRRPEWMHDKDALIMFKNYINEQLKRGSNSESMVGSMVRQIDFFPESL
ncbi:C6 transcription [Mycena sanguinolenta]|uniref:C6 transcription n=1 Tax=Mycena sanguinolenta TaxID=230812 RepID=A0A8H7CUE5_9AGAR|nr:C6 transcription [Mycena sanguinolenta]